MLPTNEQLADIFATSTLMALSRSICAEREVLADLLGNDHDKRIMATRHLLAMLATAPAAPAAAAWMVAIEWAKDAEEWGPALNEAGWLFLSELNEDPQKSALIFNSTKGPLRAAIMKYAEIVTTHCAKGVV